MSNLMIHSMSEFAPLILTCLERAGAKDVVEIGAEFGGMSEHLAGHSAKAGGVLTSIDPSPKPEFVRWVESNPQVRHLAQPSLEALPGMAAADAWVIDGDHNYYTVYHELNAIDAICRSEDKPLLAFLHDISWPCARRDFYYAPDRIPTEYRHPYSFEVGVTLDHEGTLHGRGWRGMGHFAWSLHQGGPRNGVLTAVEDFVAEGDTEDRPLVFAHIPAVFGLGVVFDASAEWAEDVAGLLLPYHQNDLIAKLEVNRLANHLAVIEWQDREAARLAG